MASMHMPKRALRVACHDFAPNEVDALRSLVNLLRDYLKHPWEVVESGHCDLLLVNLDHPDPRPVDGDAPWIGCALKPRNHAPGTLHRPLRAAEVLARLTDTGHRHAAAAGATAASSTDWCYRLRAWPLDLACVPRDAWPVLAAITCRHCSPHEIALRTGVPDTTVNAVIGQLEAMQLLDRLVERRQRPRIDGATATRGWHSLAARVGQLLGFARGAAR